MARTGSFLGPSEVFGVPLSVIHPPDNDVSKSRFHPSLLDPKYKLDDERMRELQDEILALFATLRLSRDLPPA